jgi:cytidyltransferase-like protein
MKIFQDISSIPVFKHAVITIGTFDGVHLGHQQILKQLVEEANAINGTAVVITFHPHPREVLMTKDNKVLQLTSLSEKAALLSKFGIEHLVVIPFTKEFSYTTGNTCYFGDMAGVNVLDTCLPRTVGFSYENDPNQKP